MKCYIDGSCEPINPHGKMGMGVYIEDLDVYLKDSVGESYGNTNNLAEYLALELLLDYLLEHKLHEDLVIYSDSKLLVNQMNGLWRMNRGGYLETAKRCKKLLSEFDVRIKWIPREDNVIADELSKGTL